MTVPHPTFRLLVGLVALAVLSGCGSGNSGHARVPTTTAPGDRTLEIQGEEDELRQLHLTLRDVRSIRELPPDLEAVPETSPRSDSRDTRGPCGAEPVADLVETAVNGTVDFGAAVALGHDDLLDVVGVRSSSPVPVDALLELAARASDGLARPLDPV